MDIILNWLWQGGVVAGVAAAALRAVAPLPARLRSRVHWTAMAAILALPLVPFLGGAARGLATPAAPSVAPAIGIVALPAVWWTSSALAVGIGGIWFGTQAIRLAGAALRARRVIDGCAPFPGDLEAQLPAWRRVRHTGRRARLAVSPCVTSAAVVGAGVVRIVVAPALLAGLHPDDLDRVVVHEWAHVQRRDDLADLLLALVTALAGWHPAVWWTARQIRMEREIACDELAVAVTGSAKAYAACLTTVAALSLARRPSLAFIGSARSALRRRVVHILSAAGTVRSRSWRRVAAGAAAIPALTALAIGSLPVVAMAGLAMPPVAPIGIERATVTSFQAGAMAASPAPDRLRAPYAAEVLLADSDLEARDTSGIAVALTTPVRSIEQAAAVEPAGTAAAGLLDSTPWPQASESAPPVASVAASATPWGVAADAGVAIGHGSRRAALATAGWFTRVGRSIGDGF